MTPFRVQLRKLRSLSPGAHLSTPVIAICDITKASGLMFDIDIESPQGKEKVHTEKAVMICAYNFTRETP